jgi:hypothetical protein
VVPLARFEKAVWRAQERFTATIDVADYSENPKEKEINWQLTDEAGRIYAEGFGSQVDVALDRVEKAQRLELLVTIKDSPWRNRWNIWVYPEVEMPLNRQLIVTADINQALKALKKGKKVLFSPRTSTVKGLEGKFLPVFWSPVHFPKQAGTMGLLCNPKHPALSDFPTDMHSDWQWWNLVKRSRVMVLDSLPHMCPIVESVDNFVNNRRLALVFEAQVGKGRLIFSAIDLLTDSQLPEIQQLRYSLTKYMLGHEFQPTTTLTPTQLRSLLQEDGTELKTGATSIYE